MPSIIQLNLLLFVVILSPLHTAAIFLGSKPVSSAQSTMLLQIFSTFRFLSTSATSFAFSLLVSLIFLYDATSLIGCIVFMVWLYPFGEIVLYFLMYSASNSLISSSLQSRCSKTSNLKFSIPYFLIAQYNGY